MSREKITQLEAREKQEKKRRNTTQPEDARHHTPRERQGEPKKRKTQRLTPSEPR